MGTQRLAHHAQRCALRCRLCCRFSSHVCSVFVCNSFVIHTVKQQQQQHQQHQQQQQYHQQKPQQHKQRYNNNHYLELQPSLAGGTDPFETTTSTTTSTTETTINETTTTATTTTITITKSTSADYPSDLFLFEDLTLRVSGNLMTNFRYIYEC